MVDLKCEQREAFVDGKRRRLFFMDGLLAGEAANAKAFADGLAAMQGAHAAAREAIAPPRAAAAALTRCVAVSRSGARRVAADAG